LANQTKFYNNVFYFYNMPHFKTGSGHALAAAGMAPFGHGCYGVDALWDRGADVC
jgi:hypothetical protein